MRHWLADLLISIDGVRCEHAIFDAIRKVAARLEFEYCAYGLRTPWPVSRPSTLMLNNYPVVWQERYVRQRYLEIDPTVRRGAQSDAPFVWTPAIFAATPKFWEEARSAGLRVGWAQSCLGGASHGGMLTVSRSATALLDFERRHKEADLRVLTAVAHLRLSQAMLPSHFAQRAGTLTSRETEVLKWTADGKTTLEIAYLLSLSECTVRFHVRNIITKLNVANKTAAAVYAAMNGMLR
ncbi:autoinducer binding domain-containing protein [Cupriavidus necator]|uniref:autoinducer binding domain-containing protein n=1 Tax=Cupriavidus necator TaxID=106590 RepID=UPI0005B47564|nr:autoinducer binding domain-containing protein [Cupriavidus necator]